jgi:nucleotide-binding universal stress UspA family protein
VSAATQPARRRIERILCPTDLSDASAHAIEHAVALATQYKARITAQYVYSALVAPIPTITAPVDRISQTEIQQAHEETAGAFRAAASAGVEVAVVVDVGRPEIEILNRAKTLPADLIVMGTHGASGFEHLVLGSVTEKVLRKSPCPVLTVPPHAQSTARLPFRRLLCAIDFSEASVRALDLAGSIARESGAALTLVTVLEWPWNEPPAPSFDDLPQEQAAALAEYRRYLEQGARKRLEQVSTTASAGCEVSSIVCHGKPHVEILRTAAEEHADLVVVGVHGRNPFDLALLGSTTNQVIRRATCPVLTLKA